LKWGRRIRRPYFLSDHIFGSREQELGCGGREQLAATLLLSVHVVAGWRVDLHTFVVGASAALGNDPVDDLVGIGDIAGLTVDAVGGANLQLKRAVFVYRLIDGRGTKVLTGIAVLDRAFSGANLQVVHDQMARLIFFVPRPGVVDVGQAVEGELAISFEALWCRTAIHVVIMLVTGFDTHGVDQAAPSGKELQRRVK
jgi:hypothetical protein